MKNLTNKMKTQNIEAAIENFNQQKERRGAEADNSWREADDVLMMH